MAYLNGTSPQGAGDTMAGLIQLVFTKDTMLTISDNFKDWENIKRVKPRFVKLDAKGPRRHN